MADLPTLDRAFHTIMQSFIQTGRAPHYTELARSMNASPEEGRQLLHEVIDTGYPMGLVPDTDYILSCAPFSNLPNHCPVTIDGEQKWYAQ
ncbi:MAG TPA: hypothetical protein VNL15_03690 [Dehalococcoidia bacterium]|nr:hypothetical protein [Dehalococcoidia bacterium]